MHNATLCTVVGCGDPIEFDDNDGPVHSGEAGVLGSTQGFECEDCFQWVCNAHGDRKVRRCVACTQIAAEPVSLSYLLRNTSFAKIGRAIGRDRQFVFYLAHGTALHDFTVIPKLAQALNMRESDLRAVVYNGLKRRGSRGEARQERSA